MKPPGRHSGPPGLSQRLAILAFDSRAVGVVSRRAVRSDFAHSPDAASAKRSQNFRRLSRSELPVKTPVRIASNKSTGLPPG